MSLQESNPFAQGPLAARAEVAYPAEFHFRIIAEAQGTDTGELGRVLSRYDVTAALTPSRQSAAGRYAAYSLSVRLASREELGALDSALRSVPGVRLVL